MCIDKKKIAAELGLRIRKIRVENSLTMTELAINSGMEYIQLSRIELGKINTTYYQLQKIASSLGLTVVQLIDENNMESSNHLNGENSENPKE